jgi:hypothetical protein
MVRQALEVVVAMEEGEVGIGGKGEVALVTDDLSTTRRNHSLAVLSNCRRDDF